MSCLRLFRPVDNLCIVNCRLLIKHDTVFENKCINLVKGMTDLFTVVTKIFLSSHDHRVLTIVLKDLGFLITT